MTTILEYIWIDSSDKTRSKTKIVQGYVTHINECPDWTFDGSSTGQAQGTDSDVILRPVAMYKDPFKFRKDCLNSKSFLDPNAFLVLCETYEKDNTPHVTNHRNECIKTIEKTLTSEPWFGIEQEYVLYDRDNKPYKWLNDTTPGNGKSDSYYCGSGGDRAFGRNIVDEHLDACLYSGIKICGINAEVMPSQWEYQIGPLDPTSICDQLWISRYILDRICEKYDCWVNYHPKPKIGWNGSGCHTNFSTLSMRIDNGYDEIIKACAKLSLKHDEHIQVYGNYNSERLTGLHETSSISKFTYAVSHRGCSVRIPLLVVKDKKGYLEDRRPASNMDPYLVIDRILKTVCLE